MEQEHADESDDACEVAKSIGPAVAVVNTDVVLGRDHHHEVRHDPIGALCSTGFPVREEAGFDEHRHADLVDMEPDVGVILRNVRHDDGFERLCLSRRQRHTNSVGVFALRLFHRRGGSLPGFRARPRNGAWIGLRCEEPFLFDVEPATILVLVDPADHDWLRRERRYPLATPDFVDVERPR